MMDLKRTAARPATRRRSAAMVAVALSSVFVLAACGGDEVDPTDADTGLPVESVPADPAATPAESDDPLTGSET